MLVRLIGFSCFFSGESFQRGIAAYLVRLLENGPALAVTQDRPVDLEILQLLNTDFTGERAIGLVEHVLSRDTQLLVGKLTGEGQVQRGGRDDDLRVGVQVGSVEVVHDGGDTVRNTVPIENWSIPGMDPRGDNARNIITI